LRPPIPEEKPLIGIDEACAIIQKAKPTIYALVRKGIIPAYKRGKKLYFYKEELLQWVESGRKGIPYTPPQRINYPP
jgi:mobilizable transposon, xis protein